MVFASSIFLFVFLPLFLVVYHLAPASKRNIVALIASLIFYVWGAPLFFWVLITLLIINFYVVRSIDSNTDHHKLRKKTLLVISLFINLGTLAYFKYANFFVDNVNYLLQNIGFTTVNWTEVALPIGISFFTFQSITYTLDVYWRKNESLKSIYDYLLYILLFPQLIAGPIIRFNTIAGEIKDRTKNYTLDNKLKGVYIFIIGLSKKVLIANEVGSFVDVVFGSSGELSLFYSWLGIVAYAIQIYFDFSGYSDMAIGLGKIMGFNFPENFKSPYTSRSISEFWRRWHITLGAFMRDYLYIPLGGNRTTKTRNLINLVIVFLLSGLWHGASWNFVIWGAWHGTFLMLERLFLGKLINKSPGVINLIYCNLTVLIGWVFFRAEDLTQATAYLKNMAGVKTGMASVELPDNGFFFFLIAGIIFSLITLTNVGKKAENFLFFSDHTKSEHFVLSSASVVLFIVCVSYISASGFNPFIYFRF